MSMGREPQRPIRNVKDWLQPDIGTKSNTNIYKGYNEIVDRDFDI